METLQELKDAIQNRKPLIWNDPDPIEGNDYEIDEVFEIDVMEKAVAEGIVEDDEWGDWPILIHYGGGSEAQVLLSEIEVSTKRNHYIVNEATAEGQERICEHLYNEKGKGQAAVHDYGFKVRMPFSHCGPCETDTPTIVRLESDTCAVCGSSKEIQEEY